MAAGLQVFNESGQVVFDTNDRAIGGVVVLSTGQTNGSYTATPGAGQVAEFIYNLPGTWTPSGQASRWPAIGVSGNTVSWSYNTAVPVAQRITIPIYAVTY